MKKLEIAPGVGLFNEVLAREEAMWGSEVKFAPDLLLLWREDPRLKENNFTLTNGMRLDPPETRPGSRLTWCGTHRMEGLFGIAGKGIREKAVFDKPVNLADMTPTVLYLAGMEIPSDLDGRLLEEAFDPEYVAKIRRGWVRRKDRNRKRGRVSLSRIRRSCLIFWRGWDICIEFVNLGTDY